MSQAKPNGHLATPASGEGGGVLVLHAWWGLNDTIKSYCEQLAGAGFTAFAPDLYKGQVTDEIAEAETLAQALFENMDQARASVSEAAAYLTEQAAQDRRGLTVIGFSLGAAYALDLSVSAPEQVRSVVVYYGTFPGDYSNAQASYLGHFAENDEFEPQSEVDSLEEALTEAGRPVTFYRYPGTGHWFCEPDRVDAYNEDAANLAWERTLAFLK